jgi:hypothetical protein
MKEIHRSLVSTFYTSQVCVHLSRLLHTNKQFTLTCIISTFQSFLHQNEAKSYLCTFLGLNHLAFQPIHNIQYLKNNNDKTKILYVLFMLLLYFKKKGLLSSDFYLIIDGRKILYTLNTILQPFIQFQSSYSLT